jgi:hypothetical protein
MPGEAWAALAQLGTGLVAGLVAWVVARANKAGARENAIIDQLQEEVAALKTGADQSYRRERIRDDYIHQLRSHITDEKPPPPPPWPEGLTR